MKVLFLTLHDQHDASSKLRVYQFIKYFEDMGIECSVESFWTTKTGSKSKARVIIEILEALSKRFKIIISAGKYDGVFIHKDVLPFGLQGLLAKVNPNIIFEFDDAIWEMPFGYEKRPALMRIFYRYQIKLFYKILKRAKIILAENSYLANYAVKFNVNTTVIITPIDTNQFRSEQAIHNRQLTTDNLQPTTIVIGWVGSPSTTYLLKSLASALEKVSEKHNVELHNIGGDPIKLESVKVKNLKWRDETIQEDLAKLDIGLMPLDDLPVNRGRLGYKMIIYMSLGIPYVAQDIGLNREVTNHGVNGFLANTEDDWFNLLNRLIENRELRQKLGQNGRKIAIEQYDIKDSVGKYVNLFNKVAVS